ncbi:MAG: shikimate dehydrogenase [bacterium]
MDQYAVIGHPVKHSRSPSIHRQFADQTGEAIEYSLLESELDDFEHNVQAFFNNGGRGLNVTLPFKERALQLSSQVDQLAGDAGAANTLFLNDDGEIACSNTDGIGLLRDLTENHGIAIKDKKILIVGAGGAVRGVIGPLLQALPQQIAILNRTHQKAIDLAGYFGKKLIAKTCDALEGDQFDLIINGTSASLSGSLPEMPTNPLAENASCYDMMYAETATPFMRWAQQKGAGLCLDGRGMLVEQAAESFYIWRGVRPSTNDILNHF